MQPCQVSASSSIKFLRRRILNIFFKNLPLICDPSQTIKLSNLDKSRMKHEWLLNKHFCKSVIEIFPKTWQKLSISNLAIRSLCETLSCHSNQSYYLTEIKNITYVDGNVLSNVSQVSASSSIRFLRRRSLNDFFENWPFFQPRQPIKCTDFVTTCFIWNVLYYSW